jgi:PPM family protein phosphatase
MALEHAGLTDVGRRREHNEDALLLAPEHHLFAVADGMGGHQAGEVASNLAVTALERFFSTLGREPPSRWPFKRDRRFDEHGQKLAVALQYANQRIHSGAGTEGREGMGTTCVAALVAGSRAYFGWVGDSRGYLFRNGELRPTTSDHSLVNELLRTGRLKPGQVASFQHKNVITRALGLSETVQVDVTPVGLEDGDLVLVCCDGLTGMVEDERIAVILRGAPSLEGACQDLIDAANAAGGDDNITVALARYRKG